MPFNQTLYIFSDLDDSLFQTERKCPPQAILRAAAVDRHGQTLSYFTPEQDLLLKLFEQGTVIPVTGRNTAALERVHLSFNSFRVTSHGAVIVDGNGHLDTEWIAIHETQFALWLLRMEQALATIEKIIKQRELALRCRIIEDQGLPVYVSIKGDEQAIEKILETAQSLWCEDAAQVHCNGQNMALLPPFANKERAVSFLMRRIRETSINPLFLGLGDSTTDVPFLRLCHYAITPRNSQIQTSWT